MNQVEEVRKVWYAKGRGFVRVGEGGVAFSGDALVSLPPYLTVQGAAMLAWSGCGDGGKRTDDDDDDWFMHALITSERARPSLYYSVQVVPSSHVQSVAAFRGDC